MDINSRASYKISGNQWKNYELSFGARGSNKYKKTYEPFDLDFFETHDKIKGTIIFAYNNLIRLFSYRC